MAEIHAPESRVPMAPAELEAALALIGWSNEAASIKLNVRRQTVQRWLTEYIEVPDSVAAHVRRLALFHRDHPFIKGGREDAAAA